MWRDSFRYLIALGIVVAGAIGAFLLFRLPGLLVIGASQAGSMLVADIDNWQQTDLRRAVSSRYDLSLGPHLHELPYQVGDWNGEDIPQTNLEVFILLEPEEYVYRRYHNKQGDVLWLSLIGSRTSRSFHPPQICYSTDGLRTQVDSAALRLSEGEVHALRLDAEKAGQRHAVFYFYLWPNTMRDPSAGTVLFKITIPFMGRTNSLEDATALAQDFTSQIFMSGRPY